MKVIKYIIGLILLAVCFLSAEAQAEQICPDGYVPMFHKIYQRIDCVLYDGETVVSAVSPRLEPSAPPELPPWEKGFGEDSYKHNVLLSLGLGLGYAENDSGIGKGEGLDINLMAGYRFYKYFGLLGHLELQVADNIFKYLDLQIMPALMVNKELFTFTLGLGLGYGYSKVFWESYGFDWIDCNFFTMRGEMRFDFDVLEQFSMGIGSSLLFGIGDNFILAVNLMFNFTYHFKIE